MAWCSIHDCPEDQCALAHREPPNRSTTRLSDNQKRKFIDVFWDSLTGGGSVRVTGAGPVNQWEFIRLIERILEEE